MGLPTRFALTLVVVGLPVGVVGTQLVVDRLVASLEAQAEDSVRGVLQLLESSVTNLVAAGSVIVALPVLVVFFALQKQFVSGLTLGSTKG